MITSARELADVLDAAFSVRHGLGDDSTSDLPSSAHERQPFVSIGRGSFGIIFALPKGVALRASAERSQGDDEDLVGDSAEASKRIDMIVKRTIILGVDDNRWLENDAVWHQRIEKTFDDLRETVKLPFVPRLLYYLPKDADAATIPTTNFKRPLSLDGWWKSHRASDRHWTNVHGNADDEYRLRDQILLAERIPAVPKSVRDGIINRFSASSIPKPDAEYLKAIKEHPSNDAALLRLHAGSDPEPRGEGESERPRRLKMFSLLNHPLNLPNMRELLGEEQVEKAVKMLGNALAVLHFGVGCDGRDVEFVFGARPKDSDIRGRRRQRDTEVEKEKEKNEVNEKEKSKDKDHDVANEKRDEMQGEEGDEMGFDMGYQKGHEIGYKKGYDDGAKTKEDVIEEVEDELEEEEMGNQGMWQNEVGENVFTLFGEEVSMFLLDFHQVRALPEFPFSVYGGASRTASAEGKPTGSEQQRGKYYDMGRREQWLDLTVSAFFANDPYYPRPDGDMHHTWPNRDSEGTRLWGVFADAYFDGVMDLVKKSSRDEQGKVSIHSWHSPESCAETRKATDKLSDNTQLAMDFLGGVEKECKKRKERSEEREREAAMEDWTSAGGC